MCSPTSPWSKAHFRAFEAQESCFAHCEGRKQPAPHLHKGGPICLAMAQVLSHPSELVIQARTWRAPKASQLLGWVLRHGVLAGEPPENECVCSIVRIWGSKSVLALLLVPLSTTKTWASLRQLGRRPPTRTAPRRMSAHHIEELPPILRTPLSYLNRAGGMMRGMMLDVRGMAYIESESGVQFSASHGKEPGTPKHLTPTVQAIEHATRERRQRHQQRDCSHCWEVNHSAGQKSVPNIDI